VATPDAFEQTWMQPRVSFRRSQAFAVAEQNTALWLRLVERSAEDVRVAALSIRAMRQVARTLPAMTNLSVPDGFLAARAALAHAGVVLTFVREVPDTRVCAATCGGSMLKDPSSALPNETASPTSCGSTSPTN